MRAEKAIVAQAPQNNLAKVGLTSALSDLGWGFERYPGYDFIGMSMGGDGQIIDIATGEKPDRDPAPKADDEDQSAKASKASNKAK
jgi:hypothetical protein